MRLTGRSLLSASIAIASLSTTAYAATLEEIVVTAERRTESVQDVPIAITALSETAIKNDQIAGVKGLAQKVPGLTFDNNGGRSRTTLRGVSSEVANLSSETGVTQYIDGLPVSSLTGQLGSLDDLVRIEVLRGPQGTLYGRNAVGGAINYWTKVPEGESEGSATVSAGNEDTYGIQAGYSFPIIEDVLAARISGSYDESGGYRDNVVSTPRDPITGLDADARENRAIRGVLNWTPTENLQLITRASYSKQEHAGAIHQQGPDVSSFTGGLSPQALGGLDPNDIEDFANNQPHGFRLEATTISETISWDIDDAGFLGNINLKSITGYQEHEWRHIQDSDGTSADLASNGFVDPVTGEATVREEDAETYSQEFVITSNNDSNFEWTTGAFYFLQKGDEFSPFRLGALPVTLQTMGAFTTAQTGTFSQNDLEVESLGFFAQGTWSLAEWARLTVGTRYTDETKETNLVIDFPFGGSICDLDLDLDFQQWTPHYGLEFDLNEDALLYLKVTKGFRSGGFNNATCADTTYGEEDVWSYEAGVKSRLLDDRLQLNAAVFYLDYDSYQTPILLLTGPVFTTLPVTVEGIETELQFAATDNLTLNLAVSYMDSEFDSEVVANSFGSAPPTLDIGGNEIPRAPRWSGNASIEYFVSAGFADMTFNYNIAYKSEQESDFLNLPFSRYDDYSISNAWVKFENFGGEDNGFELQLYVNNIDNEEYETAVFAPNALLGVPTIYGEPRTYGARATFRF